MEETRREGVANEDHLRDAPLERRVEPVDGAAAVGEDDRVDAVERERPVRVLVLACRTRSLPAPSALDRRPSAVSTSIVTSRW